MLGINDEVRVRHEINLYGETYVNKFNGVIREISGDKYRIDYGGVSMLWVPKKECKKLVQRKK